MNNILKDRLVAADRQNIPKAMKLKIRCSIFFSPPWKNFSFSSRSPAFDLCVFRMRSQTLNTDLSLQISPFLACTHIHTLVVCAPASPYYNWMLSSRESKQPVVLDAKSVSLAGGDGLEFDRLMFDMEFTEFP